MISSKTQSRHVVFLGGNWEIGWVFFKEIERELNYMPFYLLGVFFIGFGLAFFSTLLNLLALLNVIVRITAKYLPVDKGIVLSSV